MAVACGSVKIVRRRFSARDEKGMDPAGFHGNHVVLILKLAFDEQELMMDDNRMVPSEKLRRDDGVGDARLVFQAEKDKPFRRARPLARDYGTGNANIGSIRKAGQLDGGENSLLL
jgi:hypothetical protein